ncbi:MAG TPA: 4Fe-4S dicluster domain-containing protein, partial [Gammaproteobacteria bacterium]
MQTQLTEAFRADRAGQAAERILRACVHCGFCLATCPTYQLLGSELDSPRGRIYLIKQLLEGQTGSERTRLHLDRCLTCRSCETTCPSGVTYGHLLDVGRELIERQAPRPPGQRLLRRGLRLVLPEAGRFALLAALGRAVRPLLPGKLRAAVPERPALTHYPAPATRPTRRVLLLDGCVQPTLRP